jgi:hypothetical protein
MQEERRVGHLSWFVSTRSEYSTVTMNALEGKRNEEQRLSDV